MLTLLLTTLVAIGTHSDAAFLPGTEPVVVCGDGGAGGYEAFPDVCRLADGRLMVVFYAGDRHVSTQNERLPRGGRLCLTTSDDEGATWAEPRVFFDSPHDDRDPSITQLPDGRLACTFFMYPNRGTHIIYSEDAGETWTAPSRIGLLYNVSSPLRVLSNGRHVVGLYGEYPDVDRAGGAVAVSNEQGTAWERLVNLDTAGQYLDAETDVIELRDGVLYAIHRGGKGATMHWTTSSDLGLNWGRTQPLDFVGHSPYLHRASNGIITLAYRAWDVDRWITAMRYSVDECRTWSDTITIDTVSGAYPSLANLSDGSILVVYYEEGTDSDILARRFVIDRLGVTWLPVGCDPANKEMAARD